MPPKRTQQKRRFQDAFDDDIFDHNKDCKRPCLSHHEEFEQKPAIKRIIDRWSEFEAKWVASLPAAEKEGYVPDLRSPPSEELLKKFFLWLVRSIPGINGGRLCLTTMKKYFDDLKSVISYRAQHEYSKSIRDGVNKYITGLKKTEGASSDVAPKGLASFAVLEDILYFLWVCDEYTFNHPRYRLQMAFGMLLCSFRGIRPGEIVESSAHKGSNDGLKYKDVKLVLTDADGFVLLIQRRLKKNARNDGTRTTWETYLQCPENRTCCVVSHFLALAIADGAITPREIADATIDSASNTKQFFFPEEVQEMPLIRALESDQHTISTTKILPFNVWNVLLVELGQRAGYEQKLTSYCFRRGVGNALDKKITPAERQRELGHKNEQTFLYYLSKVSGIDSQALVMGQQQRTSSIEFIRSMNFGRNLRAPNPYTLTASGTRAPPSVTSREASFQLYQAKRKHAREEYRSFFATPTSALQSPDEGGEYEYIVEDGVKRVRPKPSRFLDMLFKYDTVRAEVVGTFYSREDGGTTKSPSLLEATAVLAKLAKPESWSLCYPVPRKYNTCTWCGVEYEHSIGRAKFNEHLLGCHRSHWQQLKAKHNSSPVLHRHGSSLEQIESIPTSFRHAMPSVDLRISTCQWEGCYFDFVDKPVSTIVEHVTSHVNRSRGNRCRWHTCYSPTADQRELSTHLLSAHGAPSEYTLADKAYYCHQCVEWVESTSAWDQHCEGHLQDLKDCFCGRIARAGVVTFAALCPFCLGGPGAPSERYVQFSGSGRKLEKHIKKHIAQIGSCFSWTCPHPLCNEEVNADESFQHLAKKHGIVFSEEKKRGKKASTEENKDESKGDTEESVQDSDLS